MTVSDRVRYASAGHISAHRRLHASEARQTAGLGGGLLADSSRLTGTSEAGTTIFHRLTTPCRQPSKALHIKGFGHGGPCTASGRPSPRQLVVALFDEALQHPAVDMENQATATETLLSRRGATGAVHIAGQSGRSSTSEAARACRARRSGRP